MVAMMTGVNALGKGRPAGLGGRRRVDRSAAARQIAGARRADADEQDDVRIAAAGGRRPLGPRRGRAARALVQGAASRAADILQRRQPLLPGHAAAQRLQPHLRRHASDGHRSAEGPRPEALGLRLHAQGHRPHADVDPRQREGPAGRPPASITQLEASLRQTYGVDGEHRRCAPSRRRHRSTPKPAPASRRWTRDSVYTTGPASTITSPARPTATRTWISVSTSSA